MAEVLQNIPSVATALIAPSKANPRKRVDEAAFSELVQSIKDRGIINPLIVRPLNEHFELIAGARRFQAAQKLGLKQVPVIIRDMSDQEAAELAIIDNLQRADVHPLDEAAGYASLLKSLNGDVKALAGKVGKSPAYIYGRLALNNLIDPAKKAYVGGQIQLGHALLIAKLQPDEQKAAYHHGCSGQDMNVRELARYIRDEVTLDLSAAPWKKDDATLLSRAGSCNACPKHTAKNADLFEDFGKGDRCLDGRCYAAKMQAFLVRKRLELTKAGNKVRDISLEWGGYNRDKRVLYENEYRTWRGCANPVVGLVVTGRGTGTTKKICLTVGCKKCNPDRERATHSEFNRMDAGQRYQRRLEIWENKIDQEKRVRLMKAILPLIKAPVKRWHLIALLREVIDAGQRVSIEDAGKLVGIKWSDRVFTATELGDVQRKIAKATEDEILRFIFAIALQRDMIIDPSFTAEDPELLTPLIGLHGAGKIDVKKIEAESRKSLEAKKPKPPKKEQPRKSKKPKGKKR